MTCATNKRQSSIAILCALTLGAAMSAPSANADPMKEGYATASDTTVVRSGFGLCVHADTGADPSATKECSPAVASVPAPVVQVIAPQVAAAPVAEPIPTIVAVPIPAPVPLVVAARVKLDADALFDFDKSALRPAGFAALDDFVDKIKDLKPEMIMAFGYTDRLGSDAYNQSLSQRRVDAVATYLESKGIDADKLHTEGRGKSQPVTTPGECDGKESASVILCLQPDRRVEIEVMVTSNTL